MRDSTKLFLISLSDQEIKHWFKTYDRYRDLLFASYDEDGKHFNASKRLAEDMMTTYMNGLEIAPRDTLASRVLYNLAQHLDWYEVSEKLCPNPGSIPVTGEDDDE
jgi:hypothetical protein